MPVNADKPDRWKSDIALSVDMYNGWFLQFAPKAYRDTRIDTTQRVEQTLEWTKNLTDIEINVLRAHPSILPILRMTTAPPIARDRLIGLAGIEPNLVESMEIRQQLPPRMSSVRIDQGLQKVGQIIMRLADKEIFPWLEDKSIPDEKRIYRASTIVADRLCGAETDPIVRNAQEKRQLELIGGWLKRRGYSQFTTNSGINFRDMAAGTYAFRLNIPIIQIDEYRGERRVNIPIDTVIMPTNAHSGDFPLLIEAKSAGDYTNTNKRKKEEAIKIAQLQRQYGKGVRFVLFLCGYFDTSYLGYEAAEGIDWVWEHRINDLTEFGV